MELELTTIEIPSTLASNKSITPSGSTGSTNSIGSSNDRITTINQGSFDQSSEYDGDISANGCITFRNLSPHARQHRTLSATGSTLSSSSSTSTTNDTSSLSSSSTSNNSVNSRSQQDRDSSSNVTLVFLFLLIALWLIWSMTTSLSVGAVFPFLFIIPLLSLLTYTHYFPKFSHAIGLHSSTRQSPHAQHQHSLGYSTQSIPSSNTTSRSSTLTHPDLAHATSPTTSSPPSSQSITSTYPHPTFPPSLSTASSTTSSSPYHPSRPNSQPYLPQASFIDLFQSYARGVTPIGAVTFSLQLIFTTFALWMANIIATGSAGETTTEAETDPSLPQKRLLVNGVITPLLAFTLVAGVDEWLKYKLCERNINIAKGARDISTDNDTEGQGQGQGQREGRGSNETQQEREDETTSSTYTDGQDVVTSRSNRGTTNQTYVDNDVGMDTSCPTVPPITTVSPALHSYSEIAGLITAQSLLFVIFLTMMEWTWRPLITAEMRNSTSAPNGNGTNTTLGPDSGAQGGTSNVSITGNTTLFTEALTIVFLIGLVHQLPHMLSSVLVLHATMKTASRGDQSESTSSSTTSSTSSSSSSPSVSVFNGTSNMHDNQSNSSTNDTVTINSSDNTNVPVTTEINSSLPSYISPSTSSPRSFCFVLRRIILVPIALRGLLLTITALAWLGLCGPWLSGSFLAACIVPHLIVSAILIYLILRDTKKTVSCFIHTTIIIIHCYPSFLFFSCYDISVVRSILV